MRTPSPFSAAHGHHWRKGRPRDNGEGAGDEDIRAAAPGIIERPEVDDSDTVGGHGWIVTVFDNDKNTWDEVMWILMVATGCDEQEAYTETWEVHHMGRSVVHHSGEEECRRVARIISRIGIRVEATEE